MSVEEPVSPPGMEPASISFPHEGDSQAVTIKKEENPFAFFLGVMTFQTNVQSSHLKQWHARHHE